MSELNFFISNSESFFWANCILIHETTQSVPEWDTKTLEVFLNSRTQYYYKK